MEMQRYKCHKEVQAFKIDAIAPLGDGQSALYAVEGPAPGQCGMMGVSSEYMAKHNPQPGGYYVRYADGYESYSPAQAFEEGYTQVGEDVPAHGMTELDLRFNCLSMAAQMLLETPKVVERAQAYYDFVTGADKRPARDGADE